MNEQELLTTIRPQWIQRVSRDLARGAKVRDGFEQELGRFYDLLEQAVATGDASWVDPILMEWANAPTETELEKDKHNLSDVIQEMSATTFDVARNTFGAEESLALLTALTPIYNYALEKAAHYESDARVSYISNELSSMQRKLERLDRSKSSFIAVAAHELKTPLTLIEGYTAMMGSTDSAGKKVADPLLDGVHTGVKRLREIVDDMIDVSLIDNSLLSLNFQPLWLNQTIKLLQREHFDVCEERQIKLAIHQFPGSEKLIFADPERIYQALRNVLSNAIKYTPDGGTVTVNGRTLPGFIEITVHDTGIGIASENLPMIFEKFGQLGKVALHSSGKTKFKGGGPGLGLPITRGIIEAHGGTIWVESEGYDEESCPGTIFHILLPDRQEATDPKVAKLFGEAGSSPL